MDSSEVYSEDELGPQYGLLGKLHCLVDDCVHLQQTACSTKVGYNAYYEFKMAQENGLESFSDYCADKEFWAHN